MIERSDHDKLEGNSVSAGIRPGPYSEFCPDRKGLRSQLSHLFLGLILFIIALKLLNAWDMQVHYHDDVK
ncbi:hypothetical protein ACO2Q8_09060 [Larkinella sp. VNQ87]